MLRDVNNKLAEDLVIQPRLKKAVSVCYKIHVHVHVMHVSVIILCVLQDTRNVCTVYYPMLLCW